MRRSILNLRTLELHSELPEPPGSITIIEAHAVGFATKLEETTNHPVDVGFSLWEDFQ